MKPIRSLAFSVIFFFPWIISGPLGGGWAVAAPKAIAMSTEDVINRVIRMPGDRIMSNRAAELGLSVMNVMWEDRGRATRSAYGPNVSDLTLQVHQRDQSHLLPIIRHPNLRDKTADIKAENVWIKVGNEKNEDLKSVSLSMVLENLGDYLQEPEQLVGIGDLSAKRDTHYLVSAQHVFVPL